MNSMRRRLMVLLAVILLFFQLVSVVWLWHESREQIGFLVNETLSAKARNNHVEKEIREAIASLLVPSLVMVGFTCSSHSGPSPGSPDHSTNFAPALRTVRRII